MRGFISLYIICLLMTGCQKERVPPEPETKIILQPMMVTEVANEVEVSGVEWNSKDPFHVRHQVKGNDVFIECIVQGITFRETSANNKGRIILYVNGKKQEEISSAAFIVKGLSTGTHRLKLEVVKANNSAFKLKKEFNVTIP